MKKKEPIGIGIEAAVIGAEKGHVWIKDILDFYKDMVFINDPKYYWNIIMPRVVTRISVEKYGFRLIPIYLVLRGDIHLYSPDVFSICYDLSITGQKMCNCWEKETKLDMLNHICAHSWWEGRDVTTFKHRFKALVIKIVGTKQIKNIKDLLKRFRERFFENKLRKM